MLGVLAIAACQPSNEETVAIDQSPLEKTIVSDDSALNLTPSPTSSKLSKKLFSKTKFKKYDECLKGDCGYDGYGGFDGKKSYTYNG